MDYEWDEEKRALTLRNRSLDFAQAEKIFNDSEFTVEDDREDYGEIRYQTIGRLGRKTVMVVWTFRAIDRRRIISMRECNVREREIYQARMG